MSTQIQMFADLSCPFAYVVHARWRALQAEYQGRVELVHRSLALEYVNSAPTPKTALEVELPILLLEEPDIPYAPWHAPASEWPVTIWPGFEAVKCAERQGVAIADDLAWSIRVAFFSESRCISMRHVLLELAAGTGVDIARFESDFDAGVCKQQVIDEAREGWERRKVPGSPTWVLPDGSVVADFGLPEIDTDERGRAVLLRPGGAPGEGVARMRELLAEI